MGSLLKLNIMEDKLVNIGARVLAVILFLIFVTAIYQSLTQYR